MSTGICSAHGETDCWLCSLNTDSLIMEKPACSQCAIYFETGMHWDTCSNRITSYDEAVRRGFSTVLHPRERFTLDDPVNHPAHYQLPGGIEAIQVIEHMEILKGNAVKYLLRAGKKNSEEEDLRKAQWYIQRRLQLISPLILEKEQELSAGTLPEYPSF